MHCGPTKRNSSRLNEWGRRRGILMGCADDPCQTARCGTRGRRGSMAMCARGLYSKDEFMELNSGAVEGGYPPATPADRFWHHHSRGRPDQRRLSVRVPEHVGPPRLGGARRPCQPQLVINSRADVVQRPTVSAVSIKEGWWGGTRGGDAGLSRVRYPYRLLLHVFALDQAGWCGRWILVRHRWHKASKH